ncbi:MAG TPA: hypothetical protein VFT31_04055 [Kribbella sp.]|nr:hypothetical protein [Kribbella sp.]
MKLQWFEGMDEQSAQLARGAIASLVGDGDLETLTQTDLQDFLWYRLPAKWVVETAEHHEVAWALGDALRNVGLDRYATICRQQTTHLIIDAYDQSFKQGIAAYRKAAEASGIEPPDTDQIAWGAYMGPAELAVRDRLASTLERAIVAGELVPGARGWKKTAQRISEEFLSSIGADGRVPLEVVEAERIEVWARAGGRHRAALHRAVRPKLSTETVDLPGKAVAESLTPARALLEGVGDGVTLTQAGYLPKALAVELNERFRWQDPTIHKMHSEADVIGLRLLHGLLRRSRLLTKRASRLSVSAEGRRCLSDDERLFRLLAVQVLSGEQLDVDIAYLTAAALLVAGAPQTRDQLMLAVLPAVEESWRATDGQPVGRERVAYGALDWRWNARTLGWLHESGDWPDHREELTAVGRVATAIGLQAVASGPRQRP